MLDETMNTTLSGSGWEIEMNIFLFLALGIIAALIFIGNTFTIVVITKTESLRTPTGYLMMNLALADIGVGLTTAIPLIYAAFTHYMGRPACDSFGFLHSVSWLVSIYNLMLLSVDRYIAIVHPFSYHSLVTSRRVIIASVGMWVLASIFWLFPLVGLGGFNFNDEEFACYFDMVRYPSQWITYMSVIFIPAFLVLGYTHVCIAIVSRRHHDAIAKPQLSNGRHDKNALSPEVIRQRLKASRTLLVISGAFYLAWAPFIIEHIVKSATQKEDIVPHWVEVTIYVLAVANSFWDPIIYLSTAKTFRIAALNTLGCGRRSVDFNANDNVERKNRLSGVVRVIRNSKSTEDINCSNNGTGWLLYRERTETV